MQLYPGLHNVALLDLFGLLSIKHGKPQESKGWRITSLQRLPFGDALLQLLFPLGIRGELQDQVNVNFGKLQSHFQPFFPEWESTKTPFKIEMVLVTIKQHKLSGDKTCESSI